MKTLSLLKNPLFWLALIILVGLIARFYKIDSPVADWHSWRQADTAAVSRNFFNDGFNPFFPKYDDMSAVSDTLIPNPGRFRFVEFPIYNSIVYFVYLLNGGVDEKLARLVSVIMSLGSVIFIYLIAKRYFGIVVGLFAALLFAILPYNVFFSRVILPEPTLVFFSLGMFYFVDRWIVENSRKLYFVSLIFISCAFLIKPMAIFYLLPLIYSYLQHEKRIFPIPLRYFILFVPALLPFVFWRLWILQFPEGIPASNWLLNGNGIRFKPAFWRWIIAERLGKEILTVTGTFLFFLGLLLKSNTSYLLHFLALSAFLYLIIFATGNVQHDYYQVLIVPALVIFAARGFVFLIKGISDFVPRFWTIPLALLFLILTIYFGWSHTKGLYQVNNYPIIEAGEKANMVLPQEAIVIAPYNGDTAFLYQLGRPGFAFTPLPVKDLISIYGTTHYISTSKDAKTAWVMRYFEVIADEPNYVIVDLTKLKKPFDLTDNEP